MSEFLDTEGAGCSRGHVSCIDAMQCNAILDNCILGF